MDGTLCMGEDPDYIGCTPVLPVISKVNRLFDAGWRITIFTARGMSRYEGWVDLCHSEFYDLTSRWLRLNNVKHHELIMGKPSATYYLDDKGLNIIEFLDRDFG